MKLSDCIQIQAITIETIAPQNLLDVSNIPREIVVDATYHDEHNLDHHWSPVTKVEFNILGPVRQTTHVAAEDMVVEAQPSSSCHNAVRFRFETNYGSKQETCVYGLGVHGMKPDKERN